MIGCEVTPQRPALRVWPVLYLPPIIPRMADKAGEQEFYEAARSFFEDRLSIREPKDNDGDDWHRGGSEVLRKVLMDLDRLAKARGLRTPVDVDE